MKLYHTVDKNDTANTLEVYESTIRNGPLEANAFPSVNLEIEDNDWPSWAIIRLDKEQALALAEVLVRRFE